MLCRALLVALIVLFSLIPTDFYEAGYEASVAPMRAMLKAITPTGTPPEIQTATSTPARLGG